MSKIKDVVLFRADDLNGAVAEVVLQTSGRRKLNEVIVCNDETISDKIESFLDSGAYRKCSRVYIVGSSFDKRLADKITELMQEEEVEFIYRDHHSESLDLSKYLWGRVLLFDAKSNPISSAKNIFREVVTQDNSKYIRLSLLIDMANASITEYVPLEDEEGKKVIEELYSLAGSSVKFAEDMIEKIECNDAFFNEEDVIARVEAEKRAKEQAEEELREMKEQLKRQRNGWW